MSKPCPIMYFFGVGVEELRDGHVELVFFQEAEEGQPDEVMRVRLPRENWEWLRSEDGGPTGSLRWTLHRGM